MLFTTLTFLLFLAVVLPLYYLLSHRWQNRMLLAASCVFYGAWSLWFLALLLLSVFTDYALAHAIHQSASPRRRKSLVAVSCIINLGALAFFKYANFIVGSSLGLLSILHLPAPPVYLNILLPIGISFYTFHSMSYIIDIYRRVLIPLHSFTDYALYVLYFPQLVAGPIARAHDLIPQLHNRRIVTYDHLVQGAWLILWGFFKKLVIADNLGIVADRIFNAPASAHPSGLSCLIAIYAFAFQIYGDFSGYTDIARGIAKLMGINLAFNFNLPYLARNPADFWRRWHISLSTWLRDYLYIPLGGNRHGKALTYRNLLLTMLLGGLWHGAAWHYVAWGAYHGTLLAGHRLLVRNPPATPAPPSASRFNAMTLLSIILMFHLTCFGWLLFRAADMRQVADFSAAIFTQLHIDQVAISLCASLLIWTCLLWLFEFWIKNAQDPRTRPLWKFLGSPATALLIASILLLTPAAGKEFIYFQF